MLACMESPQPGVTTTTVVSAADAMSTSICPTPTVSTMTTRRPAAPSRRMASGTARESPPRCPRVAIDRMKTVGSRACWLMRTRSPRMAPPLKGDVGSTASTATWPTASAPGQPPRTSLMSESVKVDFPAPGAPVSPTV